MPTFNGRRAEAAVRSQGVVPSARGRESGLKTPPGEANQPPVPYAIER